MNCTKKVLLILLPIIILFCVLSTQPTYADVKVNIKEEKTEPYSNKKDSDTVIIKNEEKTPLNNTENSTSKNYESEVDIDDKTSKKTTKNDSFESNVDSIPYESIVDVDEGDVPGTDSYYDSTFNTDSSAINDGFNYREESFASKIKENRTYEIVNKDLVVQNTTDTTDSNKVKYTTLPQGTEVKVVGVTNPGTTRYAEILGDDGNIYYENVESFYNNSIEKEASPFERYIKSIITEAKMLGTEDGYIKCISFAIIYLIATLLVIKFLDTSIFRLKNPDSDAYPYINSVARVMPGAMIGSFIIIANMFDSNAVAYYFYKGFNLLGKNYELIHWLIQIVLIYALFMVGRFVLEGFRCFTFPCMIIRSIVLIVANLASFYLCYALSYVGIAIYVLFVLYECICVNSYGCPDFGGAEECSDEGTEEGGDEECSEDGGEESGEGEPEGEPEGA